MKRIIYILPLLLATVFSSCEDELNLDLKTIEPQLVIDAQISKTGSDSLSGCVVTLSKTQDYYTVAKPASLSNGTITLTDKQTNVTTTLRFSTELDKYKADIPIEEGHEYRISVAYAGKTYEATETVPSPVAIDSLFAVRIRMGDEEYPFIAPAITFMDPPVVRNYYNNIVYINGKQIKSVYINDDEYLNGKPYDGLFFIDSALNNDEEMKVGDHIKVEMENLALGSYYFMQTMFPVAAGGAVNPISNFSGGVLGAFKAYARTSIEKTLAESDILDR